MFCFPGSAHSDIDKPVKDQSCHEWAEHVNQDKCSTRDDIRLLTLYSYREKFLIGRLDINFLE